MKSTILFLAIVTTGLSAGIFYAWTVSVIPGTKLISNSSYLETMQSINRAILNPMFFVVFFGPALLIVLSSYLQYTPGGNTMFWFLLAAGLIYLAGTIGITGLGNVPLNEALDKIDLSLLNEEGLQETRLKYENSWNNFNLVRTGCAIISFLLLLYPTLKNTL